MTDDGPPIPKPLWDHPATDRLVWVCLDCYGEPLSRAELEYRTGTPTTTLYDALRRLRKAGYVKRVPAPECADCHRRYTLT